jgi:hypothetical protein
MKRILYFLFAAAILSACKDTNIAPTYEDKTSTNEDEVSVSFSVKVDEYYISESTYKKPQTIYQKDFDLSSIPLLDTNAVSSEQAVFPLSHYSMKIQSAQQDDSSTVLIVLLNKAENPTQGIAWLLNRPLFFDSDDDKQFNGTVMASLIPEYSKNSASCLDVIIPGDTIHIETAIQRHSLGSGICLDNRPSDSAFGNSWIYEMHNTLSIPVVVIFTWDGVPPDLTDARVLNPHHGWITSTNIQPKKIYIFRVGI